MKTLKICLVILCLLPILAIGTPQLYGANFFMKEIKLTRGVSTFVDDCDFEELSKHKWYAQNIRGRLYACRSTWTPRAIILMHRQIMKVTDRNVFIDHKDGDGLNNIKSNIRLCSSVQNSRNIGIRKNNTTGFKGVSLHRKKYAASITVNYKKITLGTFKLKLDAAKAYNQAAVKYHGEFASLNKI